MGDIVISPAAAAALATLGGVIAAVVRFLYKAMIVQYEARLAEYKTTIAAQEARLKEQTTALNDLTTVVRSWTPEKQQQQVRRAVRD